MKILVAKDGHADDLVEELRGRGLDVWPCRSVRMVRVSRRSKKRVEKYTWVIKGTMFCDIDELDELEWLKGAWMRDGKYVEVTRDEVDAFAERLNGFRKYEPGDVVQVDLGFLAGQAIEIIEDNGVKVQAIILWDNGLRTVVGLEWLTPGGELCIKSDRC